MAIPARKIGESMKSRVNTISCKPRVIKDSRSSWATKSGRRLCNLHKALRGCMISSNSTIINGEMIIRRMRGRAWDNHRTSSTIGRKLIQELTTKLNSSTGFLVHLNSSWAHTRTSRRNTFLARYSFPPTMPWMVRMDLNTSR